MEEQNVFYSKIYRCDGVPILKVKICSSGGDFETELCERAEHFAQERLLEYLSEIYRTDHSVNKRFRTRYLYTFSVIPEDAFDGRIRFLHISASLISEKERAIISEQNKTIAVNTQNGKIVSADKLLSSKRSIYKKIILGKM